MAEDPVVYERREDLGQLVREVWLEWAREQPDAKPSWLLDWDELDTGQREVDIRIGETVWGAAQAAAVFAQQMVRANFGDDGPRRCDEHPGIIGYSHPECGFCWHGRDGLDVPIDGPGGQAQPVCPRCSLHAAWADAAMARERVRQLEETLRDVLGSFSQPAHAGKTSQWTCWLPTRRVERWRAVLRGEG